MSQKQKFLSGFSTFAWLRRVGVVAGVLALAYTANVSHAQTAEDFGYGSKVFAKKNPIWYHVRLDGGIIIPSEAKIVRGGSADTLVPDKAGWDVGLSFGGSFNHGSIAQIDLTGVVSYARWYGTIAPGANAAGISQGNKILLEGTQALVEANWRPLVSTKGFISPFLGVGLGLNIISWLNQNIEQTVGYKRSSVGATGLFQIGTGFDWFFATNWAIGVKYNYWIPFGNSIEVGNLVTGGDANPILYTPSNTHVVNFVMSASF